MPPVLGVPAQHVERVLRRAVPADLMSRDAASDQIFVAFPDGYEDGQFLEGGG